jgi:hypothetical protein
MPKIPGIVLFGLCITAHFGILQKRISSLRTSLTARCRQNTSRGAAFQRCTQMLRSTSTSVKRHTLKSFCGLMAVAQFERSLALSALPGFWTMLEAALIRNLLQKAILQRLLIFNPRRFSNIFSNRLNF